MEVELLFDVELLDVELLESSSDDVLDVPDEVEVPDVPELDVDGVELLFLLASVSVLATAAKARDPTAVAVNRPPVTMPTRRKPLSRLFMERPPRGAVHRRREIRHPDRRRATYAIPVIQVSGWCAISQGRCSQESHRDSTAGHHLAGRWCSHDLSDAFSRPRRSP